MPVSPLLVFFIFQLSILHSPFSIAQCPGCLFDGFENGRVFYISGDQVSKGLFNYNTITEKALFLLQDTVVLELYRADIVRELIIGDRFFEHGGNGVFYERIKAGDDDVYVRWKTNVVYEEKEGGYGTRPATGSIDLVNSLHATGGSLHHLNIETKYRLVPEKLYYLKGKKGFKRFGSFDSLAKQLNKTCRNQVKSYVTTESLDFSVLDDVVKAVAYGFEICKK